MFSTKWSTFAVARVETKLDSAIFANSRANKSSQFWSDYIHNRTQPRSYGHTHFDKFGAD